MSGFDMFRVINATMDSDSDADVIVSASEAPMAAPAPPPSPGPEPPASSSETPSARVLEGARAVAVPSEVARGSGDVGATDAVVSCGGRTLSLGPIAAVEVVVIDDDLDADDVSMRPPASEALTPLQYQINMIGYGMQASVEDARAHGNSIQWHLPPHTPRPDFVEWTIAHINGMLEEGYVAAFYIGITHGIAERWRHPRDPMRGHSRNGYQRMVICGVSANCDVIGMAEESVISRFRRVGRGGQMQFDAFGNPNGHPLCMNRNPGRESSTHGVPPFALYVVWRHNPGYNRRHMHSF